MDQIYTPAALAKALVESCGIQRPKLIADFAAGDGALLRAARERWPKAALFASDIERAATSRLRKRLRGCSVATCDFLEHLVSKRFVGSLIGKCDVVLLNPPFTCRGNSRHTVAVFETTFAGSRALTFAARALQYVKKGGELVALLPASVLTSEKDSRLLNSIRSAFTVTQIGNAYRTAFASHRVSVVMMKFEHHLAPPPPLESTNASAVTPQRYQAVIRCGRLPVHQAIAMERGLRYVHTVDLKNGKIRRNSLLVSATRSVTDGPVVLFPRVGMPAKEKIVFLAKGRVVLSDCVIGIESHPRGHEKELADLLVSNWSDVAATFGGSCAPYTTLRRVREMLNRFGIISYLAKDYAKRKEAPNAHDSVALTLAPAIHWNPQEATGRKTKRRLNTPNPDNSVSVRQVSRSQSKSADVATI